MNPKILLILILLSSSAATTSYASCSTIYKCWGFTCRWVSTCDNSNSAFGTNSLNTINPEPSPLTRPQSPSLYNLPKSNTTNPFDTNQKERYQWKN